MPVLVRYDIPTYPPGKVIASRMATIQISRAELQYSRAALFLGKTFLHREGLTTSLHRLRAINLIVNMEA